MKQTAERIETESALVRTQLTAAGEALRKRVDPTVVFDAAKASFKRRAEGAPSFMRKNATPIGMLVLGGALGAASISYYPRPPRSASPSPKNKSIAPSTDIVAKLALRSRAFAALLSALSIGLGYVGGMYVPVSTTEERLLGQPKAVLREHLDDFLTEHARGMKLVVANAFGLSRWSAVCLVAMALLVEAVGKPPPLPELREKI
jgi:hypothetical protein